jgi:hypothetical protein
VARPRRMLAEETSRKAWRAFEDALRDQNLVIVTKTKLLILDFYEQIYERHASAHPVRQAGCPTCSAIADIARHNDD